MIGTIRIQQSAARMPDVQMPDWVMVTRSMIKQIVV